MGEQGVGVGRWVEGWKLGERAREKGVGEDWGKLGGM